MARDPYLNWGESTPSKDERRILKPKTLARRLVRTARDLSFPDIDEERPLSPEPAPVPRQIRPGPAIQAEEARPSAPGDTAPSVIAPGTPALQEMTDEEFAAHVEAILSEDKQTFTPAPYPEESSYLLPQDTPWGWTIQDDDSLLIDRVLAELRLSDQITGLSEDGTAVPLPEDLEDRTKFFGSAIPALLRAEGGYNPGTHDTGGKTNYGIALKHHPEAWGLVPDGDGWTDLFGNRFDDLDAANEGGVVKRPTREQATKIYAEQYWDPIYGDSLYRMDPGVAKIVFDGAVNHGVGGMTKMVQRIVGADVDGAFGPQTYDAVAKYIGHVGPEKFRADLLTARRAEYDRLNETGREVYTKNYGGWIKRLQHLALEAGTASEG